MRRCLASLTLALVCATLASRAAAQTPAQSAAAMELFKAMKLEASLPDMAAALIEAEVNRQPGLAPYRDVMVNWLKKYMTWNAMVPQLTKMYTETFTESELKAVTAFYKTPTGQKALTKLPELMQRSAMIGAKLGQGHSEELNKLMTARSDELAKEQAKQAGAAAKTPSRVPAKAPTAAPKKP